MQGGKRGRGDKPAKTVEGVRGALCAVKKDKIEKIKNGAGGDKNLGPTLQGLNREVLLFEPPNR